MKTTQQKYLERLEQLFNGMEDEALPQIMKMIEAFALQHQKKPRLRLVI